MSGIALDFERVLLRQLRVAAFAEATTLLTLVGIAVPLKHLAGWPLGVRVMGPVHGLMFLAYLWTVVRTIGAGLWRRNQVLRLLLSAFVPFAGFFSAGLLSRRLADLSGEGAGA